VIGFILPEVGIAACLLDGLTNRQIADATGISYAMVRRRLKVLKRRFGAKSRIELVLTLEPYGRKVDLS
jgi:DNA-binding NarL/FixJ family response regulator